MQEGMSRGAFMHDVEAFQKLHDIIDVMFERDKLSLLIRATPPFDIDQPTEHASKKEFNAEKRAVHQGIKHLWGYTAAFYSDKDAPAKAQMRERVKLAVDTQAYADAMRRKISCEKSMIAKNAMEVGLFSIFQNLLLEQLSALEARLNVLLDEEKEFWSSKSRAPNYYARTIALRIARLYAQGIGERPTYGTARDGGHPSTRYSRAVEDCFQVLGITAGIRGPCEWAVQQIEDKDVTSKSVLKLFGPEFPNALSMSISAEKGSLLDTISLPPKEGEG